MTNHSASSGFYYASNSEASTGSVLLWGPGVTNISVKPQEFEKGEGTGFVFHMAHDDAIVFGNTADTQRKGLPLQEIDFDPNTAKTDFGPFFFVAGPEVALNDAYVSEDDGGEGIAGAATHTVDLGGDVSFEVVCYVAAETLLTSSSGTSNPWTFSTEAPADDDQPIWVIVRPEHGTGAQDPDRDAAFSPDPEDLDAIIFVPVNGAVDTGDADGPDGAGSLIFIQIGNYMAELSDDAMHGAAADGEGQIFDWYGDDVSGL